MDSDSRFDLPCAAGSALLTVLLLRVDFAAAAAFALVALLAARHFRPLGGGLAALPVLFAALPVAAPPAPLPGPGPVRIDGIVARSQRDLRADDQRIELTTASGRVDLHCPASVVALPGDHLVATARCSLPAVLDGRKTLRATGEACVVTAHRTSLPRVCAAARLALEHALHELAPPEHEALLTTLVLGRGPRLPAEVATAHRATGLSHLLAVSGAHAAMLAWILGLQPFGGGRRRPVSRPHLVCATLLLVVYGAITGMEPPVFRALLGYCLVAVGLRLGRRVTALQALLWPAVVSALAAPDGVLGPSFGLSYAAVYGLSLAGPPRSSTRFERWVAAPVRSSCWATLATAPLTLFWFGQLAPWTIALTPLLAPVVLVLLLLALVAAVGHALGATSLSFVTPPLEALADLYTTALEAADALPGAPVHALASPTTAAMVAALAIGAFAFVRCSARVGTAWLCLTTSAPHFAPAGQRPPGVVCFAVGHGQAVLTTLDDGSCVLVDCGSQDHPNLPSRKVAEALRHRCLDWVVLTHGDLDHVSAVADLLSRVRVRRAVLPDAMRHGDAARLLLGEGVETAFLHPGQRLAPTRDLEIMAPDPSRDTDNDRSLWVRARFASTSLCVTGDAESEGVEAALRAGFAQRCDVLVLPHHGRPNGSAEFLLDACAPKCCFVSNPFGDGRSVLGELAIRRGLPVFATATHGDLELHCVDGALAITTSTTRIRIVE